MYEEESYAHKIKISYYGGKVLHKKHSTVAGMIVDRLVNNRLTKENALEILDRLIGCNELIVFKNKLIYLDDLLKASKAKWADKVLVKWSGAAGKRRRSGTLTNMVYDTLQITYKERKASK